MLVPSENKESKLIESLYIKTKNDKITWKKTLNLRSLDDDTLGYETSIDKVKIRLWKNYGSFFIDVTNPDGNNIKIKEEERKIMPYGAFSFSAFSSNNLRDLYELVRDKVTNYNSNIDNLLDNLDKL